MRVASMFLTLVSAFFAFPSYAAEPVALAYARYEVHYGRQPGQTLTGLIRVAQTVAPDHVAVHYTRNDKDWQDVAARYAGLDGTDQLWSFSIADDINGSRSYRLAVHADTGAESIWDNNNWQDFRINGGSYPIPSSTVVVLKDQPIAFQGAFAYAGEGWIAGAIDVVNLGAEKTVRVLYRVNGGEVQTTEAHYAATHTAGETWRFDLHVPTQSEVSFSVQLDHSGQTFVDDNFGRSYQASSGWVKTLY